jgi:hypothetical protein
MSNRDPSLGGMPPQLPEVYTAKAALIHDYMFGPGASRGLDDLTRVERAPQAIPIGAIGNAVHLLRNAVDAERGVGATLQLREYLTGPPTDLFALHAQADGIVEQFTRGCGDLDITDALVGVHLSVVRANDIAHEIGLERAGVQQRLDELLPGMILALVRRTNLDINDSDLLRNLNPLYERIFGNAAYEDWSAIDTLGAIATDRIYLARILHIAPFTQEAAAAGHGNAYNRPMNEAARRELDTHAAELIQRLHQLKQYPVVSFVVRSEQLGLPWDVVVVPPSAVTDEGQYAEGAVADFILQVPSEDRTDTAFRVEQLDDSRRVVTVGGAASDMRFRLHDDGSISHGLYCHNVPSNDTRDYFEVDNAGDAFTRLRGLFIALAFDAIVPDEAVPDSELKGSVAHAFRRPGEREPAPNRITQLLLRRRRALERASVSREQRQPQGWPRPRPHDVKGYIMKMREGYQARPSAIAEADAWHRAHNLPLSALSEGHTWVPPHRRAGEGPSVIYREASFRPTSETAQHLGALGMPRGKKRS